MPRNTTIPYTFVCSDQTFNKFHQYRLDLLAGTVQAGKFLADKLNGKDLSNLTDEQFIELLVQTKPDKIFAESTFYSPKINWSALEISLLGDLSCVIPTTAYDNGAWKNPIPHVDPIDVTLVYVPGPLLCSKDPNNKIIPDLDEVRPGGDFNSDAYYHMLERRLLPGLLEVNRTAALKSEELFVTLPGIGCGQFSGQFNEIIHDEFEKALVRLLTEHGARLTQVRGIWYDNFDKQPNNVTQIQNIDLLIRPLLKEGGRPQLCSPATYDAKYKQCKLVTLVAWDHVSKPGNDYWEGRRETDDGVKAAATDTMPALTGMRGEYKKDRVLPINGQGQNWSSYAASQGGFILQVAENLTHYSVLSTQQQLILNHQIQIQGLLKDLQQTRDILNEKARTIPAYVNVATSVSQLYRTLNTEALTLFADLSPTTNATRDFHARCDTAIAQATSDCEQHRGWHTVDPIVRGILGVVAAISIIPALVIAARSKHGYAQTFFSKPATTTFQKISTFTKSWNKEITELEGDVTQPQQTNPNSNIF